MTESTGVQIWCKACKSPRTVGDLHLGADVLNPKPWADIVCPTCFDVIATVSADEPGVYRIAALAAAGEVKP
jgi:hypothetical protein